MTVTTWHPHDNVWERKDRTPRVGVATRRAFRVTGVQTSITPYRNLRDDLILGVDKPTTDNTGIIPGSTLTVQTSGVIQSNREYRNIDFRYSLNMSGLSNVNFINCAFRGNAANPSSASSLVRLFGIHGRGHTFTDCLFEPQVPHYNWNGIQGYGYTLRRCRISKCTDGLDLFNNNNGPAGAGDNTLRNGPLEVRVEQSLIHDNAWFNSTIDAGGGTIGSHSDGIQYQGGTGAIIRGNTLTGMIAQQYGPNYYGTYTDNATILIKPDVGTIAGAVIENNWLDGGSYTINIANDPPDRTLGDIGSISNNYFGRQQRLQGSTPNTSYTMSMPSNVTGLFAGNVYDDTRTPILVRRNG